MSQQQTPRINVPLGLQQGNGSQDLDLDADSYKAEREKMSFSEEKWLYYTRVIFLIFSSFATLAVIAVYMWHLIGPERLRWLCDIEISKLKDLAITIIVGLVMSATTTYFFRKK